MSPAIAFELALDHGLCLGVWLPRAAEDADALAEGVLKAEELAMAATMTPVRRRTWIGGRVALRLALERAGFGAPPVLVDDRGAPTLPPGTCGSISHKEELAVALVTREAGGARIGVDVEGERPRPIDISAKVLTRAELQEIAHLAHAQREHEVLLRFSAKEAIYKALDPFVRRYVGFHEVSVTPRPDGTAAVLSTLAEKTGFAIEARWRLVEGAILTTARVEPL
jgi:enterobactin synthetase component D / holo-[acyl-carrier protein] synthase